MLIRITPKQARLGMIVEGLEDGWLSHPFWRERFVIKSMADLERVRNGGTNLFIDARRGPKPLTNDLPHESSTAVRPKTPAGRPAALLQVKKSSAPRLPRRLPTPPAFDQADRKRASAVVKRSAKIIGEVFDDCRRGHPVVMPQIAAVVKDIADALEHNGAAFASVTRLKEKDGYTYTHSIAVCALMITLGRANNATPDEVAELGIAGMLHDIGKLSIATSILGKAGPLDEGERALIRQHPEMGHRLLASDPQVPSVALDVCLHHHERLDGTGYPFGLHADQITTAARIAVICDVYDAMTSNRPYKKGKSPADAIVEMASLPDMIDQNLLLKFMRGIGVYPVGSLVRLRSNRLAVIMPTASANGRGAARSFYNIMEDRTSQYEDVVLGDSFKDDQVVKIDEGEEQFGDDWPAMRDRVLAGRSLPGQPA
ncbi:HD-GYP domain-containing protein [Sphingomonas sp. ABOLG]|uniref:HD-GYP domain-containing protein n=1 Tax=Sphingomonas sp. ABOLG TaxID=1985880 RepID=UPI000F7EC9F4|nr:HD-GYP domain-containing protein [Sphingomonas sp. ABOLG]